MNDVSPARSPRRRGAILQAAATLLSAVLVSLIGGCAEPVDTTWHSDPGYRWRELDVPRRGSPGFTLLDTARTGVPFVNAVSDSLLLSNRILAQGGGVCLGDVDGDGRSDVFLVHTTGPSRLFRNLGGLRFEDVTTAAGVAAPNRFATGCALADVDGDRDLDLVLTALGGPNAIFVNDGAGRFTEKRDSELASKAGSTTVALADVDGDGWLDLYVTNYKAYTTLDHMSPMARSIDSVARQVGPRRYEVRDVFRSEYKLVEREGLDGFSLVQRADPDFFYRNDTRGDFIREPIAGNRRFLDEHGRPLREEPEDFGLAAMFADLDGDRAPDLYVANDFEDPDQFWRNDGRGNFRLVPWQALRSTSNSGMAVDVTDINGDGLPDLFEVDMLSQDTRRLKTQIPSHTTLPPVPGLAEIRPQLQRNTLQLNRGDGTFAEIARLAGVAASGWSWSTVFLDVDLDGWQDILVGTGHRWDVMDGDTQYRLRNRIRQIDWRRMLFEYPPLPLPNVAFRNRGDLTFEDASRAWRFDLGADISHGMALADLDGDGDEDIVINRLGNPAAILRNNANAPRIAVRLRGEAPNTFGVGATVRVTGGAVPRQEREIRAGGLYLSSSDASVTFATGKADSVTIEVLWRDGRKSVITGARPNRLYEVSQAGETAKPITAEGAEGPEDILMKRPSASSASSAVKTLFEDVSNQLAGHRHVDPYFDDFARQQLLPNNLSQLGPGVSWFDVDGDGREELLVGAGRTGTLALFKNERGQLRPAPTRFTAAHLDLTTVLGWPDGRGKRTIIAGVSSYEMATLPQALRVPSVVGYSTTSGAMTELTRGDTASVGPLALADYDGDGDLDVFVGGRVTPRLYPLAASSRLYLNDGGRLVHDVTNSRQLSGLGLVSSATFSDVDGNGWPDLVVALEWGPIRLFTNDNGRLTAATSPGLSELSSRWNGVATGDVDGDGRLDIVATSWGRNSDYTATRERPLYIYAFPGSRGWDAMLAQTDPRLDRIAPLTPFPRISQALPATALRLRTFAAYANAGIETVLGPAGARARRLEATTFDHTVFFNRGDHFEARPLPAEAQLAPAFYAGVADFNGDGREDVFVTQNFFATEAETPRYDAGRSLLMLGGAGGALTPENGQRSGLLVYGEQRGAAYADFDADGRLDLAVSQNAGLTRLFRNAGAKPGLRVRLVGPSGNPDGVGAQMRLVYGDGSGPMREVQAGSGYWSQNGAVQVLGHANEPTTLWVRWPGGREQRVPLSSGQSEVTVRAP